MSMLQESESSCRQQIQYTFISKETIKPSSPTPSHLKTYNLSLLDQLNFPVYLPLLFLYPTSTTHPQANNIADQLKNSLSQALTHYYPFSGRYVAAEDGAYVDCNDQGVDFLQVRSDAILSELAPLHQLDYQPVDQFFPPGGTLLVHAGNLLLVQLTYFACGGIALAVSLSHKIADMCTLLNFVNHWAAVTRGISSCNDDYKVQAQAPPVPPQIDSSPKTDFSSFQEFGGEKGNDFVTKKFVFPNSKLAELKDKVKDLNPTRVEVLNSLLYACAVNAAKRRSSGKGYVLVQNVNMRSKMAKPLPETYVGNMSLGIAVPTMNDDDESELALDSLTARIKNAKMQVTGMSDSQFNQWIIQSAESFKSLNSKDKDMEVFSCSSLCRFPAYKVNFGWGNPIRMAIPGCPAKNFFILMDTPSGDGIEALVGLEEDDMAIFQNDQQLLAFSL